MKKQLEMDLKKIFLTPPNTNKEKFSLLAVMVVVFIAFFGPICFSEIPPIQALFLAAMPTLSISWGWVVLLRSLFRKTEFSKEID